MNPHDSRLPPAALRRRVGSLPAGLDPVEAYLELGRAVRRTLERLLPEDWTWQDKRVLDYGCGAGRTLRHFLPEAAMGEFWGSDIDPASIRWNREHLSPPLHFTLNNEVPPLEFPDRKFDLIYVISVFSHLDDQWATWLVELNRVLAPGGRIIATFMGEGMYQTITGKPWDEDDVGMAVYSPGNPWNGGGPSVLLSPWWIREHWGRLFDIERLEARGFVDEAIVGDNDHGFVILRKTDRVASVAELEEPHPSELLTIYAEMLRLRRYSAQFLADGVPAPIGGRKAVGTLWAAIKRRLGLV